MICHWKWRKKYQNYLEQLNHVLGILGSPSPGDLLTYIDHLTSWAIIILKYCSVPVLESRHKIASVLMLIPHSVFRLAIFLLFSANFWSSLFWIQTYSSESLNLHPQSWFWFIQARKIWLYLYDMSLEMKKKISKLLGTAEPRPGYPWFSFARWSSYLHWSPYILGINNTKILFCT